MKKTSVTELIGVEYNHLTIISDLGVLNQRSRVMVRCKCGVEKEVFLKEIKSGNTKTCGTCEYRTTFKHGLYKHPLFGIWDGMLGRCNNPNNSRYKNYGGRGVTVCKEWVDFKTFYDWAVMNGWKKGLELDKDKLSPTQIGNIYCPEFCCFITNKENAGYRSDSRMIEYSGKSMCLSQWAELYNMIPQTLVGRLKRGWSVEKAITTPIDKRFSVNKKIAA